MRRDRILARATTFAGFATVAGMRIRDLVKRFAPKRPAQPGDGAQHQAPVEAHVPKTRRRLFIKYVALFVAVVCVALLSNGIFDVYFYYQEHKASLIRIQREQAEAAAAKIGQFIKEIESQLGWTTQLPWSAGSIEQRRFDALRLLRQVPAITELAQLDASGKERLRVSRLAMDVVGSGTDLSNEPKFTEAVAQQGLLRAGLFPPRIRALHDARDRRHAARCRRERRRGQSQADLGRGLADQGRRARPRLRGRRARPADRASRHQPRAAQHRHVAAGAGAGGARAAGATSRCRRRRTSQGREGADRLAPVAPLGWLVFVELPVEEAYAPLYAALAAARAGAAGGAGASPCWPGCSWRAAWSVRSRRCGAGAARIGSGDLGQRIAIKTGDELEALADQFNDMAGTAAGILRRPGAEGRGCARAS